MSRENIQLWLRREPFHPFEIQTSGGARYQVFHPEYVALGRTTLIVYFHDSDRWADVPFVHVSSIEKLERADAPAA